MKIDLANPLKVPTSGTASNKPVRSSDVNTSSALPSSSVEISKALLKIKSESSSETSFNVEKVNEIKAAIEDGRFEFDTSAIAEKLIATAHDLLNTQNLKL